jgi:hypothetical protein
MLGSILKLSGFRESILPRGDCDAASNDGEEQSLVDVLE